MSRGFLRGVCNDILEVLNTDLRSTMSKLEGQLYIFDRSIFISVMDSVFLDMPYRMLNKNIKNKIKASVIRYHTQVVKQNEGKVSKQKSRLIKKLIDNLPATYPKPSRNIKYFFVTNYVDLSNIKRLTGLKFSEELQKYGINSSYAQTAASSLSTTGVQLGHGEYGIAVSTAKVVRSSLVVDRARAEVRADTEISQDIKSQRLKALDQLSQKIIEYREQFPLSAKLDKNMVFDSSGNFLTTFVAIISSQLGAENLQDAVQEYNAIDTLKQFFIDPGEVINIKGSDSILEAFTKVTVHNFLNVKPSKRVKVKSKIKSKKQVKEKTSGSSKKKIARKRKASIASGSGIDVSKIPKNTKKQVHQQPTLNLNALKAQINARLSMTVIKNMGTPALENRTGRFARSVQVTDVVQTSKGFPSIGYDYQKYPYQTFEPGYAQGSAQRDPRTLIDRSIREIASELIVGRFYTRRV